MAEYVYQCKNIQDIGECFGNLHKYIDREMYGILSSKATYKSDNKLRENFSDHCKSVTWVLYSNVAK